VRKQTRRKPVIGLNPFQKAEMRRAWQADNVQASIHVLIGEDARALVQHAEVIIYGVISACEDAGINGGDADVCAVHDAAKALVEQSSKPDIDEMLRPLIVEGLATCERLQSRLSPASLYRSACEVMKDRVPR
jgi:hypothetical protein